jgi:hypothetical protein
VASLKPQFIPPEELSAHDIDALIAIAQRHAALRSDLKLALEAGDDQRALDTARQLCGLVVRAKKQF